MAAICLQLTNVVNRNELLVNGHPPTINGHPPSTSVTPLHPPTNVWKGADGAESGDAEVVCRPSPVKDQPPSWHHRTVILTQVRITRRRSILAFRLPRKRRFYPCFRKGRCVNYKPPRTPFSLETAAPIQNTAAPNPETMTTRPMRHRVLVRFRNGQVDHTPSAPPPRIHASRVALEASIRVLVSILQIEAFTIPLRFLPLSPIPKPCPIYDICIRILRSTTL